MAGLQALFASFSKSTPVFAKLFHRKLWLFYGNSKGYNGSKPKKAISKYFSPRRPRFGRTFGAMAPLSGDSRRQGRARSGGIESVYFARRRRAGSSWSISTV
jgi:hypothetical protein